MKKKAEAQRAYLSVEKFKEAEMAHIQNGTRRLKVKILEKEQSNLKSLIGRINVVGFPALVTVAGIKLCFNCSETGHIKKDCQKGPKCRNCHGFGHLANKCSIADKVNKNRNEGISNAMMDIQQLNEKTSESNVILRESDLSLTDIPQQQQQQAQQQIQQREPLTNIQQQQKTTSARANTTT